LYEVAFPKPAVRQQLFKFYSIPCLKIIFFPIRLLQILGILGKVIRMFFPNKAIHFQN
jgi:hypothetical protein